MFKSYRTGEEKFNEIMELFNNPDVPIGDQYILYGFPKIFYWIYKEH